MTHLLKFRVNPQTPNIDWENAFKQTSLLYSSSVSSMYWDKHFRCYKGEWIEEIAYARMMQSYRQNTKKKNLRTRRLF